jgi:hypothetical protein
MSDKRHFGESWLGRCRCAVFVVVSALLAIGAQAQPVPGNRHFVLLIDDSGDATALRGRSVAELPRLLFEGTRSEGGPPRFDPRLDTLTIFFFALHRGAGEGCKSRIGLTASVAHLLEWQPAHADEVATPAAFQQALQGWMARPCRFGGYLSPIATSPVLALAAANARVPAGQLYSNLTLAVVSNQRFNLHGASPATELNEFARRGVAGTEATRQLVRDIAHRFNFDAPNGWSVERGGLWYEVLQLSPRGLLPESVLVHNTSIDLDRVAVGSTALLAVPRTPGTGDIRIPLRSLVPLALQWEVKTIDRDGDGPGSEGPTDVRGRSGVVDLVACRPPACMKNADELSVHLFDPGVNPLPLTSGSPPLSDAVLEFSASFRVNTEGRVYDHLRVESARQSIALKAVPAASVRRMIGRVTLDNATLAGLWSAADATSAAGGLTQTAAVARVQTRGALLWLGTLIVGALLVEETVRRTLPVRFAPAVDWHPASTLTIDFNRTAHGRRLVGSFVLRNEGRPGLVGRLARNAEEPTRVGEIRLIGDLDQALRDAGLVLASANAVGFQRAGDTLVTTTREAVSSGTRVHLFLAEESIRDFVAPDATAAPVAHEISIRGKAAILFDPRQVSSRHATIPVAFEFTVQLLAERPRPPRMSVARIGAARLSYSRNQSLTVAEVTLDSGATHACALPFVGEFGVTTACEGRPLGGEPIVVSPRRLTVRPQASATARVALNCGDQGVVNPVPMTHRYSYAISGAYEPAFDPKTLTFDLHRDPTRAELELRVSYLARTLDVYWHAADDRWRVKQIGQTDRPLALTVHDDTIAVAEPYPYEFRHDGPTPILLSVTVGNSATSGHGSVAVRLSGDVALAAESDALVAFHAGFGPGDLVRVKTPGAAPELLVHEGAEAQRADVVLEPFPIDRIEGGELSAEMCRATLSLDVVVTPDRGPAVRRHVTFVVPLRLEQLPGPNWLVIDFGTSAIAAAVGSADDRNQVRLLDLQQTIVDKKDRTLGSYDVANPEKGTPFLPSWVTCDADLRLARGQISVPPGFPGHGPASLSPEAASFVTLPAITADLLNAPGRIILSPKSWLATNSAYVRLRDTIKFEEDGRIKESELVPLDPIVTASYAALAESYLKTQPALGFSQIVICYPNTFGLLHRERLLRLATRALQGRLGIAAAKHIQLVSESDAVAYAHCWSRLSEVPSKPETLLIYDLGAGTLDLTLLEIDWVSQPSCYPIVKRKHQLGVAIAGNYFDEVIARIIHETLSDTAWLAAAGFEYRTPIVADRLGIDGKDTSDVHAEKLRWLWTQIRAAKQRPWQDGRFELNVQPELRKGFVERTNLDVPQPTDLAPDDPPAIVSRQSGEGSMSWLSLPARFLLDHPRMDRLVSFLTDQVVTEMLAAAEVPADRVTTMIVSGRASLWPGLMDRLAAQVPKARVARAAETDAGLKAVVAEGAIARQILLRTAGPVERSIVDDPLVLLYGPGGTHLKKEAEWGDWTTIPTATFRIVRVPLRNPKPGRDFAAGSLRRHFYVDVGRPEYRVAEYGEVIRLRREGTSVVIEDQLGRSHRVDIASVGMDAVQPGWPIGYPLLQPDGR